jgi:hypothetical protein
MRTCGVNGLLTNCATWLAGIGGGGFSTRRRAFSSELKDRILLQVDDRPKKTSGMLIIIRRSKKRAFKRVRLLDGCRRIHPACGMIFNRY